MKYSTEQLLDMYRRAVAKQNQYFGIRAQAIRWLKYAKLVDRLRDALLARCRSLEADAAVAALARAYRRTDQHYHNANGRTPRADRDGQHYVQTTLSIMFAARDRLFAEIDAGEGK